MKGYSEQVRAEYFWKYHLLRNQSVIVDLMQGQYKSTLQCPDCSNISISYDPFMMLSLPIPENTIVSDTYYYVPHDPKEATILSKFTMKSSQTMVDFRKLVAEQMDIDPWSFTIATVDDDDFEKQFCRNRTIADLTDDKHKVFVYQNPPHLPVDPEVKAKLNEAQTEGHVDLSIDDDFNCGISREWIQVPIRMTKICKSKHSYYSRKSNFSYPRLFWVNQKWTLDQLNLAIFSQFKHLFEHEDESLKSMSVEDAYFRVFDGLEDKDFKDYFGKGTEEGEGSYTL